MTINLTPLERLAVFVVGGTERSGKTTVAARCAALLGTPAITSSAMLNPLVEKRLQLPRGTIAAARARDHNAYRSELIFETNRLAERGLSAGLLCVEAGYRVIDGMRRAAEVEQSLAAARARGWYPVILYVERKGMGKATDNTEASALQAMADAIIFNAGSLDDLYNETDRALRRFIDALVEEEARTKNTMNADFERVVDDKLPTE